MNLESRLQAECVAWLWNTYPRTRGLLYHIPNGGLRGAREAATLKAIGVIPGMPDLCLAIPHPQGLGAGLYIEMKTDTGSLSKSQKKQRYILQNAGHWWCACRSFEHFKKIITEYLEGSIWLDQSVLSEN